MVQIASIDQFLGEKTPDAWVSSALQNLEVLLIDHAHCEKKAAATAISLMSRYPHKSRLVNKMSSLAREELLHFEKVLRIMRRRDYQFQHLSSARYAKSLHQMVAKQEPQRLIDQLIIGAFIEARSCERFARLINELDDELALFYGSLLKSEARHFEDYLSLAQGYADEDITSRIDEFRQLENELVTSNDTEFRFHSGVAVPQAKL